MFIYLATSAECSGPINRPTAVKGIDFVKKLIWWNYNIFEFLYIFDDFLILWWYFFVESLPNHVAMPELSNWSTSKACRHARTFLLVNQQSLASTGYYQQNPKNFNKTAACSHHCPLRHPASSLGHWYTGVYLRIFDPAPAISSPSWGCAPPVTTGSL